MTTPTHTPRIIDFERVKIYAMDAAESLRLYSAIPTELPSTYTTLASYFLEAAQTADFCLRETEKGGQAVVGSALLPQFQRYAPVFKTFMGLDPRDSYSWFHHGMKSCATVLERFKADPCAEHLTTARVLLETIVRTE